MANSSAYVIKILTANCRARHIAEHLYHVSLGGPDKLRGNVHGLVAMSLTKSDTTKIMDLLDPDAKMRKQYADDYFYQ